MKKLLYILLLLPFLVNAQTFQGNGKNVQFYVGGGTTTGSPGGTIQVDRKVLSDSLISKDSTIFISAKGDVFLYLGKNYPYVPGAFSSNFSGFSGDTLAQVHYLNGTVNVGNGDQYWLGFINPAEIEDGNTLLDIRPNGISLRVGDTLHDKRDGLSIRGYDSTPSDDQLPGFGLSYYDYTRRFEAGFSGYPGEPTKSSSAHADHFIFDVGLQSDISLFQVDTDQVYTGHMFDRNIDSALRKWNTIHIDTAIAFHVNAGPDFRHSDGSALAILVDTNKKATLYGQLALPNLTGSGNVLAVDISGNVSRQTFILDGQSTLNFPPTAGGASSDLTIAVTGAMMSDPVSIGIPNASVLADSIYIVWVSAPDTITIRFTNNALTSQDPDSGTFKVRVSKF